MVSLYDRLGGHVLKWSNLKGQQWGGATLPLQHDGEFFNIEVKVGAGQLECRDPKYCFLAKTPVHCRYTLQFQVLAKSQNYPARLVILKMK